MAKKLSEFDLLKISFLGMVGSVIIRLLMMTVRVTLKGFDAADELHKKGKYVIYAFWHGRMLAPVYTHKNRNIAIMVSRNVDGEYIAQVIRHMGFKAVLEGKNYLYGALGKRGISFVPSVANFILLDTALRTFFHR